MKLLILPINNCFCYHSLIFISPWYAIWQLLLQPDVTFLLKWAAFSKPFFYFAFLSPCSDLSAVFESLLSNQTKIQAPLSPHINPSLVCLLQLCLIRGLLSVSISHKRCCCVSNASLEVSSKRNSAFHFILLPINRSLVCFSMGRIDFAAEMPSFPSLFWLVSTFVLSSWPPLSPPSFHIPSLCSPVAWFWCGRTGSGCSSQPWFSSPPVFTPPNLPWFYFLFSFTPSLFHAAEPFSWLDYCLIPILHVTL